jgi:hypothetical protein
MRFKSVDPLTQSYPYLTPYQFASNSPIANIDLDGLEAKCVIDGNMINSATIGAMTWSNIKYKVAEGNTIIMRMTFATGPDNRDDKEIMLNDGGAGSEITIVEFSTNGRNSAWNFFSGGIKGGLIKISGPVEPITYDNSYTAGLLPRSSPDVEPAKEGVRKGIRTINSTPVVGFVRNVAPGSGASLSNADFEINDVAFEDEAAATNSLSTYLNSLPSNTASATINLTVKARPEKFIPGFKTGQKLLDARIAKVQGLIPSGLGFPVKVTGDFTPDTKQTMTGASTVFNTTLVPTNAFDVIRQRVQQKTVNGTPVGPIQNVGRPTRSTQANVPEPNGTLRWDKKKR